MTTNLLPYFNVLRIILKDVLENADLDDKNKRKAAIASRLVDGLAIEHSSAHEFKQDAFGTFVELAPKLEAYRDHETLVSTLENICNDNLFSKFGEFMNGLRTLSSSLLKRDKNLAQSLIGIESDYSEKIFRTGQILKNETVDANVNAAANMRDYDTEALRKFIQDKFPEESDAEIEDTNFLSGGRSKLSLEITLDKAKTLPRNIALRADANDTFGGISAIEEFEIFKILHANDVCVPRPIAAEPTGKVFGSPFMLSEKVEGKIIGHMFNLPREKNLKALQDIAQNLAFIHKIPPFEFGDEIDNAKQSNSFKTLAWLDEGYQNWQKLKIDSPLFEAAFEWLKDSAQINDTGERSFVHGDFGLNNILIKDSQVTAILDVEFANISNPAYDLGYFYYMAEALHSWDSFLNAYQAAGATLPSQEELNYNILFATVRLGVMVSQAQNIFTSGSVVNAQTAEIVADQFYNETIVRISESLKRVWA